MCSDIYLQLPISINSEKYLFWHIDVFGEFNLYTVLSHAFVNSTLIFYTQFQYLMEGSYNKVFLAKGNIPAESYTFFIDILLDTIR